MEPLSEEELLSAIRPVEEPKFTETARLKANGRQFAHGNQAKAKKVRKAQKAARRAHRGK